MKTNLRFRSAVVFLVLLFQNVWSDSLFVRQTSVRIQCKDFESSQNRLMEMIEKTKAEIQTLHQGKLDYNQARNLRIEFTADQAGYEQINKNLSALGYIEENNTNSVNNSYEIQALSSELNFLQGKLARFSDEFRYAEDNLSKELREKMWQNLRQIEDEIFVKQTQMNHKKSEVVSNRMTIELTEEIYTPQSSAQDSWLFFGMPEFVNMPGAGFSMLDIENPKTGFSGQRYSGFEVKYLFTKGKSYFQFGALKLAGTADTDSTIKELFIYSFGQDFYPRYLGRGQRRFFNLYSGYAIGGFYATSALKSMERGFISTSIGLELVKTNYLLFDTRCTYFIPFYENRNLRGLIFNSSFNFVF